MNDTSEVKLHFLDYWRVIRVRWAILLITFLLVMVTAGVTCFFLPRQYYSKVTMEVKPDDNGLKVFDNDTPFRTMRDPNLQPTQFQIIQSKEILYPVIDNLKLVETWSAAEGGNTLPKEEVYGTLLKRMVLSTIRNTDMIEIGVYSTDRVEASNIANMIAVVYQKVRRDDQMQIRDAALAQLREEVASQRKNVEATQIEMQKIRLREGIVDPNPESPDSSETPGKLVVTDDEKQLNELKTRIGELQIQLAQTARLKPEELMTALTTLNIQDPTISKVLPQFQEASSEEARLLNGGLGENHPRVKSLRAQKEVYSQQLLEGIASIRNALAIRLKVAESNLDEFKKKMDATKLGINKTTNQYQDYVNIKSDYIKAKRVLESAEQRLSTQSVQLKMTVNIAKIWEKAEPSMYPSKPSVIRIMGGALFIGLVFGIMLAFFIEYLDTSVKTLDDVERYLKTPVLAVIPKGITSLYKLQGGAPDAEAYRILRTNIEFNSKNPNAKTMTLVSGGPGEGKSTTLNNLAVTCAKGGYNVLIVDADLRRPSQHTFFDLDNEVGLSDVLTGKRKLQECIVKTAIPGLSFLPSGTLPEDAVGILNSQSMIDLISNVRAHYDLIFFDSPPILGVSDAAILASEVDTAIMVVQYRRFPRAMLQRVKGAVANVGGHLLGIVLNNVETKHDSGYQYYTQYYDYYTPDAERKKRKSIKQLPLGESLPEKVSGKPGDY
ncbi:MAG: polysaccharide biosynthesis tyrosine autokinase [Verrucomicrobia bacterium]|nr:polysaccharide biosynthesis tyrosine autokinase [Verrucomicrobiota bacterium]